ncbi:MAG: SDR family NAD(P)-dependent oxidoreductase [Myxococcales bacterium]|nr:SDR family NAD(P)-dependent oxidoreductase [Myxococcales bacterium]
MKELKDRVAVVTGAASGIGRALAERFLDEGMRVVAADVEAPRLRDVVSALASRGEIVGVPTDVADAAAVDRLADASFEAFGRVDVLCNNAGVLSGGFTWDTPLADWHWVLGVNLYGVVHGVRSFVPRMEAQGTEGHVVNVASMAGVTCVPMATVYHVSKHGVVALSECLYKELLQTGSKLRVSVLCPEMVDTDIGLAERNRPAALRTEDASAMKALIVESTAQAAKSGLAPSVMAERVVRAIRDERFYVLSDDAVWRRLCDQRLDDVREGRNPSLALPVPEPGAGAGEAR